MSLDKHRRDNADLPVRCAVVTCSDTRTIDTDTSGRLICELVRAEEHELCDRHLIPDDPERLKSVLDELLPDIDVILITGGTGLSGRDNTPDVLEARFDTRLPGFGELFRMLSWEEIGPAAMLSRAVAGVIGSVVIFSMPGSSGAVRLAMEQLIVPELRHIVGELGKQESSG